VPLPATSGNADFERVFRVHQNTHEWLPIFLASLWICAVFLSDLGAAAIGVVWLIGRLVYAAGYSRAVEKRLPGFFIQASACILLFLGAAVGVAQHLMAGASG
jgi:glutathione S-transferase